MGTRFFKIANDFIFLDYQFCNFLKKKEDKNQFQIKTLTYQELNVDKF